MSDLELQDYQDSPDARAELISFLKHTGDMPESQGTWAQRLAHWWDENPFSQLHPMRGSIVRAGSRLVGFGGCIPASYALHGEKVPALLATTLRAESDALNSGTPLLKRMRRQGEVVPLVITTPIPKLQHYLDRLGTPNEKQVCRHVFACGFLAGMTRAKNKWPALDEAMHCVADLSKVKDVARSYSMADRLEKWISIAALKWQMSTPTRRLHFVGAVDDGGVLHSFLILSPRRLRGLAAWEIVESFTTRDSVVELQALAGRLVHDPSLQPHSSFLLTVAAFASDRSWDDMPALSRREQRVCHYFMLPDSLHGIPKHTVMAEGDLLL